MARVVECMLVDSAKKNMFKSKRVCTLMSGCDLSVSTS